MQFWDCCLKPCRTVLSLQYVKQGYGCTFGLFRDITALFATVFQFFVGTSSPTNTDNDKVQHYETLQMTKCKCVTENPHSNFVPTTRCQLLHFTCIVAVRCWYQS